MSKKEYEDITRDILFPILMDYNIELVDVEYVREKKDNYLRVFIEKDGGVGILDCEKVSRALSNRLDEEDFIIDEYILEVSSPGDRPFNCDRDFERNIDNYILVKTYEPVYDKKTFNGILKSFGESSIILMIDDEEVVIERKKIAKACVDFKF